MSGEQLYLEQLKESGDEINVVCRVQWKSFCADNQGKEIMGDRHREGGSF